MVQGRLLTAHSGGVHGDGGAPRGDSSLRQGAGTASPGSPDLETATAAIQRGDREKTCILGISSAGGIYESDSKLSYAKVAKIASMQQDELDSLSKTIKKSKTLLIDEIKKGQTLTNEHAALKEKFEELQSRHDLLSANHEKLTYEFLQRKVALENLKEAHEELESVNLYLMAQQGYEAKPDSDSPCLT